jgi:hypothetical protein
VSWLLASSGFGLAWIGIYIYPGVGGVWIWVRGRVVCW